MTKLVPIVTKHQYSIVVGHILGDGYLYKNGRLQVEQSKKQENYVVWLYHELFSLVSGPIGYAVRTHPKTQVDSFSCRFYTKAIFKDLEKLFYQSASQSKKRKKVLPLNFDSMLNATVLAVWFMDDGGKAQNTPKAAYINATSFTEAEREQIKKAFFKVFNLKINIHKAGGNNQWNFYIPADSYETFYALVEPIISQVPSMIYKLA